MRRSLVLKKETLAELTPSELGSVAGGATPNCPTNSCNCYPTWDLGCRISDMMRDCLTVFGC